MSRNANYDKARRQAVGIYRAASPKAYINAGVELYSGGDYRVPDGAKLHGAKPQVPDYDPKRIVKLPPGNAHGARELNRKRSGSDPRQRNQMVASGVRCASPRMAAVVGWESYAVTESFLIPRRFVIKDRAAHHPSCSLREACRKA